jgi:hypothetical protein
MPKTTGNRVTTSALLVGAIAVLLPAASFAQGKSNQAHGHAKPPSGSSLPGAAGGAAVSSAAPLAWLDDANLIEPGAMSFSVYATRWTGTDAAETCFPVFDVGVGVTRRLQFTASVPRIVGSSDATTTSSLGTTYFSAKYAAYINDALNLRLAVAPTLEVLGSRALGSLPPGGARAEFGVPVSLQFERGRSRIYTSAGWFSRGAWFTGAGAATGITTRVDLSASLSHSWTSPADVTVTPARSRTELSGGASFAASRHLSLFGSVGHTIATTDENGAGATVAGGVSLYVSPAARPSRR